jgi:phosphate transport system permease protein
MSEEVMNFAASRGTPVEARGTLEESGSSAHLRKRRRAEQLFQLAGRSAIAISSIVLIVLLGTIGFSGVPALFEPVIQLEIHLSAEMINPDGIDTETALRDANYAKLITRSLQEIFPDATGRKERRELKRLVSSGAVYELRDHLLANPEQLGTRQEFVLPLSDDAGMWVKAGHDAATPESEHMLSADQASWLASLLDQGRVFTQFNLRFFTSGDSRDPELAGIFGALIGTILTLIVTLGLCFPIGVGAAIYLEEFAKKGRLSDFIEININNLAAVPSVVFGLLGLAVFLNFFNLPRSAPLVGGLVLSLMTLPTVIIAARSALKSVPPSIREAALGIGASPVQVVFHHILPLATPGIMTGTIVGMARALGESAPLLMIGMVAFVADIPEGLTSPSTVLPVQIYIWADSPERAFEAKTSAAIMVLLTFLLFMNAAAILIRRKFERRW